MTVVLTNLCAELYVLYSNEFEFEWKDTVSDGGAFNEFLQILLLGKETIYFTGYLGRKSFSENNFRLQIGVEYFLNENSIFMKDVRYV